ncbi:unnamed protein product [Anisakis simplex]|nr:unnamed protein product [Anisakis simplex]
MGREWCIHSDRFQRATAIQQYASSVTNADNFLSTEFALRFLFGAKGCAADTKIRYQKLAALVDVLAEKAQLSQ